MSIDQNVFKLFKDNEKLEEGLSDNFIEILKKCSNPHLINIYGDDKFGKRPIINKINWNIKLKWKKIMKNTI